MTDQPKLANEDQEFTGEDGTVYVVVPKEAVERRKLVTPTLILLVICVVMNGVGLLAIWATNYYDSQRQEKAVVSIDCNNASRLSELESGVSQILNIPKSAIVIKPCAAGQVKAQHLAP